MTSQDDILIISEDELVNFAHLFSNIVRKIMSEKHGQKTEHTKPTFNSLSQPLIRLRRLRFNPHLRAQPAWRRAGGLL